MATNDKNKYWQTFMEMPVRTPDNDIFIRVLYNYVEKVVYI